MDRNGHNYRTGVSVLPGPRNTLFGPSDIYLDWSKSSGPSGFGPRNTPTPVGLIPRLAKAIRDSRSELPPRKSRYLIFLYEEWTNRYELTRVCSETSFSMKNVRVTSPGAPRRYVNILVHCGSIFHFPVYHRVRVDVKIHVALSPWIIREDNWHF